MEEDGTGLAWLIRGTELIARNTDAARTYYHYASDEMGSTTHIVDEAGNVQNRYEYDAWGNLTAQEEAIPNRFKYTGQQLDPVTQQYYLRARFYNPVIARFTQEDPYRGDGLNLYAYCANNPVYYVDPSGNVSQCVKDAYKKHREQGISPQEALNAANRDLFYQRNKDKGMSDADALNRAEIDLEVHRAMQKYQILVNQSDAATGGSSARIHGIYVHADVAKKMDEWVNNQNFKNLIIYTEVSYKDRDIGNGSKGSSRIDILIQEIEGNNPMVNENNYYMGDIKTGKTKSGSTYGEKQMDKNERNVFGDQNNGQKVTHWQFNPGNVSPIQTR